MKRLSQRVRSSWNGLQEFTEDARRILPYFRPYRHRWVLLFAIANLYTLLSMVDPLLFKFVIDEAIVGSDMRLLHLSMLLFIAISIVSIVMGYYSSVLYERISQNILFDIRTEVYEHLQRLDILFFEEWKTGDLLSRLNTDITSIENFLSLVYDDLLINVLKVLIIFSILVVLSWEFAVITMIIVPVMVYVQKHYGRIMRFKYRDIREASADLLSFFQERLSSMRLVKVFGREEDEAKRQREKSRRLVNLNVDYVSTRQIAEAATGLLTFSVMLFVLWYGGFKVITGQLSIGSLIAIYTYIGRLFGPVRTLTDLNISFQTTVASARRVFELLDEEPQITEEEEAIDLEDVKGRITFDDVTFSYDDNVVFDHINLEIEPGETIGLVGASGAGKTTLSRLILRLFDPDEGTIRIDGHDARELTIDSLRDHIGIVEQDLLFFHTSIRENIAYADPDATEAEIIEAAKQAGIHDFITSLPDGYDTDVGERGSELSRGERQRIALARVFLKDPEIIIFDEATSSLDPISEQRVQESIRDLAEEKTMIVIAHRLDTMQYVDRLVVLEGARIAETGTFEELAGRRGTFWSLYSDSLTDAEDG